MQNDIIMEINRKRISNTKDYEAVASRIKPDRDILLLIFRDRSTLYITLSAQ